MIVRQQVINYMTEFAENFIHFNCADKWDVYVENMKKLVTYGDHLTLHAACCVYNMIFLVLDATNESRCVILSKKDKNELKALDINCSSILGYYPEDNGAHYISI
jgi:hypothetical protein